MTTWIKTYERVAGEFLAPNLTSPYGLPYSPGLEECWRFRSLILSKLGFVLKNLAHKHRNSDGAFTLIELIAAIGIIILLASFVLPVARVQLKRRRETELRRDLRAMRSAINRYKDFSDSGLIPVKADTYGYPPDLATLVEGVPLKGTANTKYKFLRKIPPDPMTGRPDWGLRSVQDDLDSSGWGGQNVFDVYSKSQGKGLDNTPYTGW